MKRTAKTTRVIIFLFTLLVLLAAILGLHSHLIDPSRTNVRDTINRAEKILTSENSNSKDNASSSLPDKVLLKVPFTVQAPNANWDATHEESCEEASLIMLKHFIKKEPFGTPEQADQEILSMIKYETDHGYKQDVTMDDLSKIARDYYGLNSRVEKNISIEDIKKELASGKPVIVPAAGKMLDNPNFKNGGPVYHNLVIVGYDNRGFITNDPGTRKGEGFKYSFDNLYNSIHDWNAEDINKGNKTFLVID